MTNIDIVVVVRDEEENIPVFLDAIDHLTLPESVDLRIIFVEDSSTDGTRALLQRTCEQRPSLSYFSLARGSGHAPAIVFGISDDYEFLSLRHAAHAAVDDFLRDRPEKTLPLPSGQCIIIRLGWRRTVLAVRMPCKSFRNGTVPGARMA